MLEKFFFEPEIPHSGKKNPAQFMTDYVGIDTSGADFLSTFNLDLIGVDYLSIAPLHDLNRPHQVSRGLAKGVVLLEGIDLSQVSANIYQLICLPLKLTGVEGAPVGATLID